MALHRAPGIGPILFKKILAVIPDLRELFDSNGAALSSKLSLREKTRAFLRHPEWARVEQDQRWAEAPNCHIVTLPDSQYPLLLREIADPPPLLFVHGNPALLNHPQIAIVGSRNPSAGGIQTAEDFAEALGRSGLAITSGLALGIDAACHRGALRSRALTVAVAGTGLDRIYPARHRDLAHQIAEHGALVSEFPVGTPPIAANFPRRNRIISGLSLGTLVVEAALKSGSLITARLAAEQGREVFAIPGSIKNPLARGCHELVRLGAKLTEHPEDVLEELGPLAQVALPGARPPSVENNPFDTLNPAEDDLINTLGFEPTSIDTLVARSGLTAGGVSAMLLTLELQGRVTSSGGLYSRT
ncbi:MAG: DNA-protecting protein DprA [Gammaproteobacteria bacterium]|nr:DNA-protecting protein DprA [Gammaproteobacteria bacterium]